jgi:hypothetical protein
LVSKSDDELQRTALGATWRPCHVLTKCDTDICIVQHLHYLEYYVLVPYTSSHRSASLQLQLIAKIQALDFLNYEACPESKDTSRVGR